MYNPLFGLMVVAFVPISLLILGTGAAVNGQSVISIESETHQQHHNNAPIIGVLAQEMSRHLNTKWPGIYTSYIAASYIKFVEGGGARAVPIW